MPLVVASGALLRLIWNNGGVPYAVNVYGVVNTGAVAINQGLADTLGAAIKSAFGTSAHATSLGPTIGLGQVGIRDIRTANQPEYLDSGPATLAGGTGDLLPLNVSLCVTLRTAFAGRSFRGRTFLCGFTELTNSATGTANSTATNGASAWVQAIQGALQNSGMNLGVLSRTRSVVNPVTSIQVRDAIWDTQRKRAVPGI